MTGDLPESPGWGPPWEVRPEVLGPLFVLATMLVVGWWRLGLRAPAVARPWRLVTALVAVAVLAGAVLSPLHSLGHVLLTAHMIQHGLLVAVAAPALLLAQPFPLLLWALPAGPRRRLGRLAAPGRAVQSLGRWLMSPVRAWLLHVTVLWAWHSPALYDAALRHRLLHDLEHLSFFVTAVLFWWPVLSPAPRWRPPPPPAAQVVYLVLGAFQGSLLALLIGMSPRPLYPTYASAERPWGWSPLDDQRWAGVVMWAGVGLLDMAAVLGVVWRSLGRTESATPEVTGGPRRLSAEASVAGVGVIRHDLGEAGREADGGGHVQELVGTVGVGAGSEHPCDHTGGAGEPVGQHADKGNGPAHAGEPQGAPEVRAGRVLQGGPEPAGQGRGVPAVR